MNTPNNLKRILKAFAFTALVTGATTAMAADDPPNRMTYQGFLVDANGIALGNASPENFVTVFRIYNSQTSTNALWADQQTVTVDKGYFSVLLGEGSPPVGFTNAVPTLAEVFTGPGGSERFVSITVTVGGDDLEIKPRLQMVSSPYAYLAAGVANDSIGSDQIAAGAVGQSKIATNAVTATQIAANSVGQSEISTDGVGTSEIAEDAVGSSELANNLTFTGRIGINQNQGAAATLNVEALTSGDDKILNLENHTGGNVFEFKQSGEMKFGLEGLFVPGAESNSRIVSGTVKNLNPGLTSGVGWSATIDGLDRYTVSFDDDFDSIPVVTVTAFHISGDMGASIIELTTGGFEVAFTYRKNAAAALQISDFCFIAIGDR